jgi:hypothetical protein
MEGLTGTLAASASSRMACRTARTKVLSVFDGEGFVRRDLSHSLLALGFPKFYGRNMNAWNDCDNDSIGRITTPDRRSRANGSMRDRAARAEDPPPSQPSRPEGVDRCEEGMSVPYIARTLRHASPAITLSTYAHVFAAAEHGDRARERMEQAFGEMLR